MDSSSSAYAVGLGHPHAAQAELGNGQAVAAEGAGTELRGAGSCRASSPAGFRTRHRHPSPTVHLMGWGADGLRSGPRGGGPRAVRRVRRGPGRQHPAGAAELRDPGAGPRRRPVLAKVEYLNPGGSVKDRIAVAHGRRRRGSGDAEAGRHDRRADQRQHRHRAGAGRPAARLQVHLRLPRQGRPGEDQRAEGLRRRGRRVPDRGRTRPTRGSYYSVSDRLARETPGAWKPDQYSNPANPQSHYETTGPEIWAQTDGRITTFVTGMGTGGTISGIGRYLKEASGGSVRIVGADPEGSVYSGGTGRPYLVEGVGEDFWPSTYDRDDRRRDHPGLRRRLLRDDPAAGPRGGPAGRRLVRHGGRRRAAGGREADQGRRRRRAAARRRPRLPNKIFSDKWMADYGFVDAGRGRDRRRGAARASPATTPVARAHPPERDRPRGDRHPARVRRQPDAGRPCRAAGDRRRGRRARSTRRRCSTRCSPAPPASPTGSRSTCRRRCRSSARARASSAAVAALGAADALVVHVDGKPAGVRHPAGRARSPRRHARSRLRSMTERLSGFSTRGRSTPARSPTRPPARSNVPVHLDLHVQAGRRRRAARRLRVQPQRQPDPHGARRRRWPRSRGAPAAWPSPRGSPPRTRCCAPSARPATTSCWATTPTAARSG